MAEGTRDAAGWALFPHTADIGIRGHGTTPAEAFANAARALGAAVAPLAGIAPDETVVVHCEAPSLDVLLVDWLTAVITEMVTPNMLLCRVDVEIEATGLAAVLTGEPVDIDRHAPAVEAKGATLTGLSAGQAADRRMGDLR